MASVPLRLLRKFAGSTSHLAKCNRKSSNGYPNFRPNNRFLNYKAAVLRDFGKPLVIEEIKVPKLREDQIRIKIHSCGVNSADVLTFKGEHFLKPKLPYVPGFEIAGEVLETGKNVSEFKPGDRVVALNKETHGGFAEQCISQVKDVWSIPPEIDYVDATALVDSYATAYVGLVRRGKVKPNDTVLITAAAGAMGLAAVDLAANVYQAKVIGVCGTPDKESLVREKGAWSAISYNPTELVKTVKNVTDGKGADVVFDAVGGDIFLSCLKCVAHEGKVIVAGFASKTIPTIPTDLLLPHSCALIGVSLTHYRDANLAVYRESIQDIIQMRAEELIDPHIHGTFNLTEINDALNIVLERKSTGKVVLVLP